MWDSLQKLRAKLTSYGIRTKPRISLKQAARYASVFSPHWQEHEFAHSLQRRKDWTPTFQLDWTNTNNKGEQNSEIIALLFLGMLSEVQRPGSHDESRPHGGTCFYVIYFIRGLHTTPHLYEQYVLLFYLVFKFQATMKDQIINTMKSVAVIKLAFVAWCTPTY